MAFQDIPPVDTVEAYLDQAFGRAKARASQVAAKKGPKTALALTKQVESVRISVVKDGIVHKLERILTTFPRTDELTEFYNELLKCTLDFVNYKKSLGAVAWAVRQVGVLWRSCSRRATKSSEIAAVKKVRTEFYGRVCSVLKQINKNLLYLQECRKIIRSYPIIKSGIPTIAIVGFPNVGKTTLLFKLTGSMPEIASYAFTTKNINVSYAIHDSQKMQFLDTPGSLNRFEKMNNIEKQAYLAIKLLADKLIYVFDPTEPYPLEKQFKLFKDLLKYKKPVIIYISKTDIDDAEVREKISGLKGKLADLKGKIADYSPLTNPDELVAKCYD